MSADDLIIQFPTKHPCEQVIQWQKQMEIDYVVQERSSRSFERWYKKIGIVSSIQNNLKSGDSWFIRVHDYLEDRHKLKSHKSHQRSVIFGVIDLRCNSEIYEWPYVIILRIIRDILLRISRLIIKIENHNYSKIIKGRYWNCILENHVNIRDLIHTM